MRKVGIEKALYYRIKEFDSYYKGYPKTLEISLVDTILKLGKGDYTRLCDLENPQVVERLKASPSEEESFKVKGLLVFSPDVIYAPFNNHSVSEFGADKSAFTFLLPKDDISLFVCLIVLVREGDFLSIFASNIRFSTDVSVTHGIRGPVDNLWLDYSQVTGTLNQMLVSELGGPANVCLAWEVISDDVGTETRTSWRVSVKPTKSIMPFDPLVRVAAEQE
ncbi:uncharacterized protein N7458_006137 [Penicillium daleae]|uniref:Uncharacterized protein n=1 Tax=Penicillium daleae TaxID=63821 RepID=A0AAD6C3S7_9EURO|nr:uncharacterized protein N7458_006137 [Penicillium daleae]KAJ5449688.1 hypothetical protein N7458_006137 [Penicillium daleae]